MEAAKKMMEKLTGGKKLQKDQCLIIILVGILLCVIAVPVEKKDSKSGLSNIIDDTIDDHKVQTGQEDASGYAGYWEEKLESWRRTDRNRIRIPRRRILPEEGALSGRAVSRRVRSIRRTDRGETYPTW